MEVDTPTPPTMLYDAEEKAGSTPHALEGVFAIQDFLNQTKDTNAAELLSREAVKQAASASKKIKTGSSNSNATPLVPVAVGARSSKHTILLHEKYQALGIPQPLFTYQGGSDSGWTVSVSFPGLDGADELQGLTEEQRFNSKQEAKEALSKKALSVLEELENTGRVKKATKSKKKSKSGSSGENAQQQQQAKEEKEPGPNYVGQLLEFQRSTSAPQPTYTDYQSGTRFACLLTIDGQPTPFGSLTTLFPSKKSARQDAARHAVTHFQAQGVWPQDATPVGGIKKAKKTPPPLSDLITCDASQSPGKGTTSNAQKVASQAQQLALPTPEWRYTPHESDKDFHTVSCFFKNGGPHSGPIGTVRNVFGKKKAKEECARLTLEYLVEVRERRLEYGLVLGFFSSWIIRVWHGIVYMWHFG
ncbi:hypothetical protein BDW02DRAFT_43748 [Decorospora gaudefroyi]|uniref:DRBM domain-containing protein n=1 Tax=Decorospora gaudefroyi TaxID=184978 RepID=A0A6A5K5G2_9PLEO|nr:hypothetical protein BDW02DRAFT_43748 [Decorospora gaudefroyi]